MSAERDTAKAELANANEALALTAQEARLRAEENERLARVLRARSAREARMQEVASDLQEKISALPTTCVFSPAASRVLWEIYDSAIGVQDSGSVGHPTPATD